MSEQDEIIVLKEIDYKDYDKILHCFSKKRGRIQVMARGAQKSNSENMSIAQTFNYCDITLIQNKEMFILINGSVLNSFYRLRQKYENYVYGSYILEILNHVLQENDHQANAFEMTVRMLEVLEDVSANISWYIHAYEIKLISMMGFKPQLEHCAVCGAARPRHIKFSISEGGIICNSCGVMKDSSLTTQESINDMFKLLYVKFEHIATIKEINIEALKLIRKYFNAYVGKEQFKSLKLLEFK
jgi:DNA repair protein RecO (recombination protein O)